MTRFALQLFGFPQIFDGAQPVELKRRKEIALLAYLAVTGKPHSRDALAALLWPDYPAPNALGNLRRALSALRKTPVGSLLHTTRTVLTIAPDADYTCDLIEFGNLLATIHTHDHGAQTVCSQCADKLRRAVALYNGDFLAGFTLSDCPDFDGWQTLEAENLRQGFTYALQALAQIETRQGNYASAIDFWRRIAANEPLHEIAHRQIMLLCAWMGQTDAALRQYATYATRLQAEFAVQPSAHMRELVKQVRCGAVVRSETRSEPSFSTHNPISVTPAPSLAPSLQSRLWNTVDPAKNGANTVTAATDSAIKSVAESAIESPVRALGLLQRRKQTYFFRIIDADGDGQIGWEDFARYLHRAEVLNRGAREGSNLARAKEDMRNWWHALAASRAAVHPDDHPHTAKVELHDWLSFWGKLTIATVLEAAEGGRTALHSMEESARIHFQLFDRDQDTLLSAQDYANWMAAWGMQADAHSSFRRLDQDRDGFLSTQEIIVYLRQFHLSNDPEAVGNYLYGPHWNTSDE